jgi:hypothetical protein
MVADMKAAGIEIDDAGIKAAIDNYENQPGVKQEAMKAVKSMLQSLQGKTPDEIAETLAQDSLAVFEAGKNKSEIPLDNVLNPPLPLRTVPLLPQPPFQQIHQHSHRHRPIHRSQQNLLHPRLQLPQLPSSLSLLPRLTHRHLPIHPHQRYCQLH